MKVTISNVFGSSNRGDALLVEALHKSILDGLGPETQISGIAHFPELENNHLPNVEWTPPPARSYAKSKFQRRLENAFRLLGTVAYTASGAPNMWGFLPPPQEQRSSIQAIKGSDLVISCAGGFLLDVNASILGNLAQIQIAHEFKVPVIIAPQTIGPIRNKALKHFTAEVLKKAEIICARERFTYEFLIQELGISEKKVIRTTDIAFEHGEVDRNESMAALQDLGIQEFEKFIGCTVVDWSFPGSAQPSISKRDYESKMVALIKEIYSIYGYRTLLFNQVSSDLALASRVSEKCGNAVVLDTADRSTSVMRGMIERAELFIGSRFHSCVFALLGRIPTASLAYTYKSTGIMEDLGLSSNVWDIDSFKSSQILEYIDSSLSNRDDEVQRIDNAIENLKFPRFSSILSEFSKLK